MGSKPRLRTALAASTRARGSSPGRKVTATGVQGAICGAASVRPAMSFAVISSEYPSVTVAGACSQLGWILGVAMTPPH